MPPITIDCQYLDQPQVAGAYLVRSGDEAAFVDNNTSLAVPRLLAALDAAGLSRAQVRYVIVTHVHLDHAGGTGALAAACPEATVLCHPRAERHLVDPKRLVKSAQIVYGVETFARLYGTISPIPAARVRAMADGETVTLGSRPLTFLHTRGHANHHTCILDAQDEGGGTIYTGDAFGLTYPRLQRAGLFCFPSTSPTEFDAAEARAAVRRIVDSGAVRACPTHFGAVTALEPAAAQLLAYLDRAEEILEAAVASDRPDAELSAFCRQRLDPVMDQAAARSGLTLDADDLRFLELDRDLNAQGVAYVAGRRRHGDT